MKKELEFQLVLPCYNEAKSLRKLVERVVSCARKHSFTTETFQLVIVDNGSSDQTASVLGDLSKKDLGRWFSVVTVPVNQGYGHGVNAGLSVTTAKVVGWSHADEQCDPNDAFLACELVRSKGPNSSVFVKGNREGRERSKVIVSRLFEMLARLILGLAHWEINAQPKVFPRRLLDTLTAPPKTFAFDLYVLYRAVRSGFAISEIPVAFPPRAHGNSRWAHSFFSRWRTMLGMAKYIFSLALTEGRANGNGRWKRVRSGARSLLSSRLFWIGLTVRLACMPFFGSDYLRNLFIPFVDWAILHPFENPWHHLPPHMFPYGPILLVALAVPKYLAYLFFGELALGNTWVSLTLMKIPLLGFDFGLLVTLFMVVRNRKRELLLYYWLSPIVVFVSYIHGQLDVASIFFCSLSLVLVSTHRFSASALALALGTLCKFHVVLAVPVIMLYLWNNFFARQALFRIIRWLPLFAFVVGAGLLPVWWSQALQRVTFFSPEAARLFALQIDLGAGLKIYLGPLLLLMVLGRFAVATRFSQVGLILGNGALFGTLLLSTAAMPGWYFWITPSLAVFFTLYLNAPRTLYWVFSAACAANAAMMYHAPWPVRAEIAGLSFTFVQASLLGTLVCLWVLALRSEVAIERRTKPLLIGIAGDSGAGKDRLTRILSKVFSSINTVIIAGDDYHKWERGNLNWQNVTHLNPRANNLALMKANISKILSGLQITKTTYNHDTGRFDEGQVVRPGKTVIVQGLHTLYFRSLRNKYDLTVFVQTDESLRFAWKLQRDIKERGYQAKKVQEAFQKRKQDSQDFIQPQSRFADWIVEVRPLKRLVPSQVLEGVVIPVRTTHALWSDVYVDDLGARLKERGCQVDLKYGPADSDRVFISILGEPSASDIREVAFSVFPNLRELTRSRSESEWVGGQEGIFQLITLALLRHRVSEGRGANEVSHQAPSESNRRAA